MSFEESLRAFVNRINSIVPNINTEEATKTSLIMPFFQLMQYDIFNPKEFTPEFIADVGIKKGEKVDYAIMIDNEPVILIECKSVNEDLKRHDSQLYRYFGTTTAKFAILTNGIIYRFYTDIDETNKMDEAPFLEINLLKLKDYQIPELMKFTKTNFDSTEIFDTASELKYMGQIRQIIKALMDNPDDDFVRLLLNHDVYTGVKTQNIVDRFRPIVKKSMNLVIAEMINDRLKNAMDSEKQNQDDENKEENAEDKLEQKPRIVTTQEELDSYYLIKSILRKKIEAERITYEDKETYFVITLDGRPSKWICRLYIKDRISYMTVRDTENKVQRYDFETIDDLYKFNEPLEARLDELLK